MQFDGRVVVAPRPLRPAADDYVATAEVPGGLSRARGTQKVLGRIRPARPFYLGGNNEFVTGTFERPAELGTSGFITRMRRGCSIHPRLLYRGGVMKCNYVNCGEEFEPLVAHQLYCGPTHAKAAQKKRNSKTKVAETVSRNCLRCKGSFSVSTDNRKKVYCSKKCKHQSAKQRNLHKRGLARTAIPPQSQKLEPKEKPPVISVWKVCQYRKCGKSFETTYSDKEYCRSSHKTYEKYLRSGKTRRGRNPQRVKAVKDYIYADKIRKGCSECPERRPNALAYHHVDPKTKKIAISSCKTLIAAKEEIEKCIVLCHNCHMVKEYGSGYKKDEKFVTVKIAVSFSIPTQSPN
jgi:hypothetical protein